MYMMVIGNVCIFFFSFSVIGWIKLLYFLNFLILGNLFLIFKKMFGLFIFLVIIIGVFKFIILERVLVVFIVVVVVRSKCIVFLNI